MKPKDFVVKYYPYAKQIEDELGLSSIAILAQCALESGWGEHAPGNMMFGIKDTDGINGNEQLITTTEYLKNPENRVIHYFNTNSSNTFKIKKKEIDKLLLECMILKQDLYDYIRRN